MNNAKTQNIQTDELLSITQEAAERLVFKQLVNPIHGENTNFVAEFYKPQYFTSDDMKTLYKFLLAYYKKYERVATKVTLDTVLEKDVYAPRKAQYEKLLNEVYNIDEQNLDEKFVQDTIVKITKSRAVYFTILEQIEEIDKTGNIGDCLGRFEEIVRIGLDNDLGIEYFKNIDNHINFLTDSKSRTPFGYTEMDKYTYGGLPSNDACLFVIMAQPGLGKSQLMMNIGYNWLMMNKKVVMFTLEMSENMYSQRMSALISGINVNKLKEDVDGLKKTVKTIKMANPMAELRIKEFATGTCSPSKIRAYLKKLKESTGFEPDLIIVDYLNIMKPNSSRSGMNLYEKCGAISEELRAISCELKKPIITAVQAGRQNGGYAKEDISMDNVQESSGITATADALFALFQLDGDRDLGRIGVKIIKNRLGGYVDRIYNLSVNYETLRMTNFLAANADYDETDNILGPSIKQISTANKTYDQDLSDSIFGSDDSNTINESISTNGFNDI